jgi:iron complex transport system substrate-binding protein
MLHRTLTCVGLLCLATFAFADRTVTDSAGRTVTIPDRIEQVYAAGPPASILTYMLAPEMLTGWPRAHHAYERPFLAPEYVDLPVTGRLTGRGSTANLELVITLQPDVILDFGSIRSTYVSLADETQAQTGIPYLLIDGRFNNTPTALRLLGNILGVPERGERLAGYADALFAEIDAVLATIPEERRPSVYLARGPDGLETGVKGSINTEIIERAGGRNIADYGEKMAMQRNLVNMSMEEIIASDPDIILTWDRQFFDRVYQDPLWADIRAVKQQRVYFAPSAPFGWIDRPPSINRLIGLKWLTGLLYPEHFQFDLKQAVREYYRLFYHVDVAEADLNQLISWSTTR